MKADLETLIAKRGSSKARVSASYRITKINRDEQIVTGEVYAPYVLDSHKEMMLPEDLKKLAHAFVAEEKVRMVDTMHSNKWINAVVIESFIARKNDPDYQEGAWVLSMKINDERIWGKIRKGELNGYSLEAMVYKQVADVEYDYIPQHFGFTEENDGHSHAFCVEVDENGRVIRGATGPATSDGHTHDIRFGTATELGNDHAHRYFLNEVEDED